MAVTVALDQQPGMIDWGLVTITALAVLGAALLLGRISFSRDLALRMRTTGYRSDNLSPRPLRQAQGKLSVLSPLLSTITRAELPILLLLAPIVLFSSPLTVGALAVIVVIWWSRWRTRGYLLPRTPLDWPIALMIVMLPVSLLVTFDMGFSLGKVALLIYGVALYYAIVDGARGRPRLKLIIGLYLLAGGLLAVLGLLGTDWQHKVPGLSDIVSILPQIAQRLSRDQTGFHPNIVAGALLWVVLPLLALAGVAWSARDPNPYRGPASRVGLLLLLVLTGGTFLLTQSRSALVSAFVGVGLLVWLAAPRLRIWLVVLTLLAVAGAAIVGPSQLTGSIGDAAGPQFGTLTQTDNLVVRIQVWQSALHAIADYPLTGIGMDTFRRLMPLRYPAAAVPDSYDIGHAHNQLLQAALDLGLPGLVGYLALWVVAAMLAAGSYRQAAGVWQRALAAGIGAGLLASFLHGLADAVALVSKPGVMFWGLLGINTALWLEVRVGAGTQAQAGTEAIEAAGEERELTLRGVAAVTALRWRMNALPVLRGLATALGTWWHRAALPFLRKLALALLKVLPLAMITLIAGMLRFYRFDALSLWLDEGVTLSIARMPWPAVLGLDHVYNAQPPLYYALVKLVTTLGTPELLAGRLVSVTAGTLTVPVLYTLAARLAGTSVRGLVPLLAGMLLAVAPLHIWYSQDATPYALSTLLVGISYLALVSFRQTEMRKWAVVYGAGVLLSLYTELSALYALLPQAILLAITSWEKKRQRAPDTWPLIVAAATAVLLFVPWLATIGLVARHNNPQAQHMVTAEAVGTSLLAITGLGMGGYAAGGEPTPWNVWSDPGLHIALSLVSIPAAVLGGIALLRRSFSVRATQGGQGPSPYDLVMPFAVPVCLFAGTIALAVLAGLVVSDYSERAVLYALVGWAALVGAAASVRLPLLRRLAGALSILLLLALSGWTTNAIYSSADKQHWRDFAGDVARAVRFGWPVLTYPVDQPVTADLLDAYRPGVLSQTRMSIDASQYHALPKEVAQGGPDAVWLAYVESAGPGAISAQFREAGYRRVLNTGEWHDLRLDLYVRNGAQIGKDLPINGSFQGDNESATGWQLPLLGVATFSPADGGGRQLTLRNYPEKDSIVWQALLAQPGHLYLLSFEARANMTTGEAKAFLICATAQGDWPLVAPNGGGQIVPNDRAWHKFDITALCPTGTSAVRVDLRNVGLGEVDYRHVELQEAAPR